MKNKIFCIIDAGIIRYQGAVKLTIKSVPLCFNGFLMTVLFPAASHVP